MKKYLSTFMESQDITEDFKKNKHLMAWHLLFNEAYFLTKKNAYLYDYGILCLDYKNGEHETYSTTPIYKSMTTAEQLDIGILYYNASDRCSLVVKISGVELDLSRIHSFILYTEREDLASLAIYTTSTFRDHGLYYIRSMEVHKVRVAALSSLGIKYSFNEGFRELDAHTRETFY